MFFSKVSSFKLSNTFDFLFSILTSKEESVNTIESLTTEYGDSPGWIALLFLQEKTFIYCQSSQQLQKLLAI